MRNRRGLPPPEFGPRDIPLPYTAFHLPGRRPPSPSPEGLCQGSLVATAEACYGTQPAAPAAVPPCLWPKGTGKQAQPSPPTMSETEDLKAQVSMHSPGSPRNEERSFHIYTKSLSPSSDLVTFQMDDAACGKFHCLCFLM